MVLAIGSSTILGKKLDLLVSDALVEFDAEGKTKRLGRDKYYLPGSVLRSKVDNTSLIAQGLSQEIDFFFNNSPVFRLGPDAAMKGVRPVAWFDSPAPLRSGSMKVVLPHDVDSDEEVNRATERKGRGAGEAHRLFRAVSLIR